MIKDNNFLPEQDTQSEKTEDIEKNRKFYTAQKTTSKFPELPSKKAIDEQKECFSTTREMPDKYRSKDLKTPKFEKEIDKMKEWIIKFCKEIGFSESEIRNRLTENDDIHILSKKIFKKIIKDKHIDGRETLNEVFINNSISSKTSNGDYNNCIVLHELIHSICITKIYLTEYLSENVRISGGYKSYANKKLVAFNEGLTEITTQQILSENNICPPGIGYLDEIIFITELAKDIAEKTEASSEEILTHFQKGMIRGENKYLKIIVDIYGKEAFNNLVNMQCKTENIIKISKDFNLPIIEKKINDLHDQNEITVDIGNNNYNIKSTKKEKLMEQFKKIIKK